MLSGTSSANNKIMLYIFTAGVLWGTIGVFVKQLASLGADGNYISILRMGSALIITFIAAFMRYGTKIFTADRKILFPCALMGVISNGAFNIFYTYSIRLNGMAVACILMYSAPVFTAIASRLIFREKFSFLKVFALAVNILGCVLTVTGGDISGNNIELSGVLAGLATGFCYGMAAVFARLAGEKAEPLVMSVYGYFFALAFLLIFARTDFSPVSAGVLGTGFLFGLIPTAFAYMVYYIGLKKVRDTSRVPVIASIEPVTAVVIGMLLYNEHLGTVNVIGVAVVLFSIIIMMKAK